MKIKLKLKKTLQNETHRYILHNKVPNRYQGIEMLTVIMIIAGATVDINYQLG